MSVYLSGLASYLPANTRTNEDLVALNPSWSAQAIFEKTGIRRRPIASDDETATDLGERAAERLLSRGGVDRDSIDALLFCTQSPDYHLPTSACLLQERLGLGSRCGALDFTLGCSGFTYGLWLASGLITSGASRNVLLVVADTYSKYCDVHDLGTATLFGDAGAAALLTASPESSLARVGETVVGTDGRGAKNLIVPGGGARRRCDPVALRMNGPEIFSFTLGAVRSGIDDLLKRIGSDWSSVDLFLLHQANGFMLEHLRRTMKVPAEKLPIDVEDTGNTVSASIPLLIERVLETRGIANGETCVLAGFGVGYSWAMTALHWGDRA